MKKQAQIAAMALSVLVVGTVGLGSVLGRTAAEGAYKQLAVFSEVLSHIQTDYVEDPDLPRVTVGALQGLLESLDPYSSYLTPKEYETYLEQKKHPPAGDVGLVLTKRFGLISVVTVLPESPAARAELDTGDVLESIAGFFSRGMSIEQAQGLLRGEPGTSVKVSVVREQRAEPQPLELVRARLVPTKALSAKLENDIAYIKIAGFEPGRAAEVRAALRLLEAQGARKLIFDLRDAATGSVEEGVETARLFVATGLIVSARGQQFPNQAYPARPGEVAWTGPLAVLINIGTAGPAEIVAAAVLDNQRGDVVGQRSYGIGSVQREIPLDDGSALLLSVAKYYAPSGKALQDGGVTPSVPVEPADAQALKPVPHQLPAPGDPVVLKALELLRAPAAAAPARKAA